MIERRMTDAERRMSDALNEAWALAQAVKVFDWVELGEAMRARREEIGLSVRDLAKRAKCSPTHVSDVERALRQPSQELIERILEALVEPGGCDE
jgi:predicted transcriptional regulator